MVIGNTRNCGSFPVIVSSSPHLSSTPVGLVERARRLAHPLHRIGNLLVSCVGRQRSLPVAFAVAHDDATVWIIREHTDGQGHGDSSRHVPKLFPNEYHKRKFSTVGSGLCLAVAFFFGFRATVAPLSYCTATIASQNATRHVKFGFQRLYPRLKSRLSQDGRCEQDSGN